MGLGLPLNDVFGEWMRRREINDRGCIFVRPDRYIAWRSYDMVDDCVATLLTVVKKVLAR